MLFTTEIIKTEEVNEITNFFENLESEVEIDVEEEDTTISKYITSLATLEYAKSIEEINAPVSSNRIRRKRNFQQVIQQSFFYGANRFGTNFIA